MKPHFRHRDVVKSLERKSATHLIERNIVLQPSNTFWIEIIRQHSIDSSLLQSRYDKWTYPSTSIIDWNK